MRPLAAFTLLAALAGGCYAGPTARPANGSSRVDAKANVVLREVSGNVFKLSVFNLSTEPMIVSRDAFYLVDPAGERHQRLPGGPDRTYGVAPGQAHDVNVRFNLAHFDSGQEIKIDVAEAITINGQPVALPPVTATMN